jgi:mannose-1-phosphate guanylyltransferase/phosphomannomutase
MKALVLAAGEGTRLRPLTLDRPKPMLPIAGRPLLEHLIALLAAHGIREIAINLHYRPEAIVDHFGDGSRFGVRITYSREPQLLGSAGAARRLDWFLDDTFLVLYGDVLTDVDLSSLIDAHRSFGGIGTIALSEADDPRRCGIAQVDKAGRITRFIEKPTTDEFGNLANSGIYVLDRAAIDHIPPTRPFDFGTDLFPALLSAGLALYGVVALGYVLDIGSVDRYHRAESDLLAGRVRSHAAGAPSATESARC